MTSLQTNSAMMNGNASLNSETTVSETLRQVNGQLRDLYENQSSIASTTVPLNASTNSQNSSSTKKRMFQVRRTFLLIVTFDVIFMVLLWIIYNQIKNIPIDQAFTNDVINYSIKTSLFDIVGLSALRFILLMISYAILKWSHWIFVAFATLGSTGFIIAKTCVFTISKSDKGFTDYGILIVSFILAWIEIWFFDYRVIPHERRLRQALTHNEHTRLIASNSSRSASPIPPSSHHHSITMLNEHRQSFYSPIPSIEGSDTEDNDTGAPRTKRADSTRSASLRTPSSVLDDYDNTDDYEKQADEVVEKVWHIFNDKTSWVQEAASSNGEDVVLAKTFPKWGKVFRLTCIVPGDRDEIAEVLFERQEDMVKWSPTVNDCRILEVINRDLFITYQLTNEQAQGIIAKRDFVNLNTRRFIDNIAILAAQACPYPKMPPKENCVRGENGPTAYIIEKNSNTTCKFTMLLNVDLKGWLPQYLINSSLASVQLTLAEALRNYLSKSIDLSSSGSFAGDIAT